MLIPLNTPSFPQTLIPRANFPRFGLSVALSIVQKISSTIIKRPQLKSDFSESSGMNIAGADP